MARTFSRLQSTLNPSPLGEGVLSVERVAERAPIMGNRVLALVRKMLNFAVDHDWIDANPAARVQKPARETSRR